MYRKTAFLVCAMAALISFNNAHAAPPPNSDQGIFEVKSADGNYKLGFSALLQTRLEFANYQKAKGDQDKNKLNFDIPRARFGFYGNVFDPNLTFLFQAQFENEQARRKSDYKAKGELKEAHLTDFSVNYAFSQEFFHIAAGKFKVPLARQLVMSPAKYQFNSPIESYREFSLAANEVTIRDIGIMFHNGWNNPLEYALAVVRSGVAARLAYNFNGIDGYDAVDLSGGDFRFALGVSGFLYRPSLMSSKFAHVNASADFIIKAHGFATNGFYFYDWRKDEEARMGGGLDLGYLIAGSWEPALRFGWDKPGPEHAFEALVGLNYYAFGHNLKTQLYSGLGLNSKFGINNNVPIVAGLQLQFAL